MYFGRFEIKKKCDNTHHRLEIFKNELIYFSLNDNTRTDQNRQNEKKKIKIKL